MMRREGGTVLAALSYLQWYIILGGVLGGSASCVGEWGESGETRGGAEHAVAALHGFAVRGPGEGRHGRVPREMTGGAPGSTRCVGEWRKAVRHREERSAPWWLCTLSPPKRRGGAY